MKTLLLTLVGVVGLTGISWGQTNPPSYIQITNSSLGAPDPQGRSWDRQYNYVTTTTNLFEAKPVSGRSTPFPNNFVKNLTIHWDENGDEVDFPEGTKYHTYYAPQTVQSGPHAGKPTYSMVMVEFPNGQTEILHSSAMSENGNDWYVGWVDFNAGSQVPTYEGTKSSGGSWGDFNNLGHNFAVVWEGGGFGPGYNSSMALPSPSGGAFIRQAQELNEGLEFINGQWTKKQ
jgi:hypothetical protein